MSKQINIEGMENRLDLKVKINKLKIDWVKENNPVKLGDVVHHYGESILVKEMQFLEAEDDGLEEDENPQYLYTGSKLTVKGTPFKNEIRLSFMQSEVTKINANNYEFEFPGTELEDFKTEELLTELKERGDLPEATDELTAEELAEGREDEFNTLHVQSFGDLNTPHEKETFKRFLCDLLGVSYHTPTALNLTVLKNRLK